MCECIYMCHVYIYIYIHPHVIGDDLDIINKIS